MSCMPETMNDKACKTESKSSFVCQLKIGQLSHMADISSMILYT